MRRDRRTGITATRTGFGALFLLLFLPRIASANVPLPSLYGFGAPFFLSVKTFGLLILAILLIESAVLRFGLGLSWGKAFALTALANVLSSATGLVVAAASGFVILLLIAAFPLYHTFHYRWGYSRPRSIALGFLPALFSISWALLTWPEGRGIKLWTVYVSLVPAFLLTIIIESVVVRWYVKTGPVWRWVFLANGGSYALLVVILLATSFTAQDNPILTSDYLSISAVSLARSGKVDQAMGMTQMMHDMDGNVGPYSLKSELAVARILAEKGHREEAKSILERVSQASRNLKEKNEDLENEIVDVRRILEAG